MKFVCTKEHLQNAIRGVSGIAGRNPVLPILRHVLLKSERGKLRLAATDLEVGVLTWVPGRVEEEEGALATPVKPLGEYVANLPSDHVHLAIQKGTLTITCGSTRASFQGESAENFPLIPTVRGDITVTLPARALISALEETTYAAATDDTRPELAGVLFQGSGTELTLAATDSYRLAEAHVTLPETLIKGFRIIVPVRAANELRRALDGEEGATLTIGEGQMRVETPTTHLISRLLDGTYPDYAQIIPATPGVSVSLLRQDLLRAIRGAGIFSSGDARSIVLETAATALRVAATAQELGETLTEVPAEVHGAGVSIHFNHRFLLDALSSLSGERIQVGLTSSSVPVLLRPVGTSGRTLALVMPIKT